MKGTKSLALSMSKCLYIRCNARGQVHYLWELSVVGEWRAPHVSRGSMAIIQGVTPFLNIKFDININTECQHQ